MKKLLFLLTLLIGLTVQAYKPPYIGEWKGRNLIGEHFTITYDSLYWHTYAGTAAFSYVCKKDTMYLTNKYVVFKLPFKYGKYASKLANITLKK